MAILKNQFDDVRKVSLGKMFMPVFILPISTCVLTISFEKYQSVCLGLQNLRLEPVFLTD